MLVFKNNNNNNKLTLFFILRIIFIFKINKNKKLIMAFFKAYGNRVGNRPETALHSKGPY